MPNYIQLINNETNEAESFVAIDEKLCELLGRPCDPKYWVLSWYDIICARLAFGSNLDKIISEFQEDLLLIDKQVAEGTFKWDEAEEKKRIDDLIHICNYLKENYNSNSWAGIGRG